MKAAVLHAVGGVPRAEDFPDPRPMAGEVLVHMRAAALKPVDRMMARGSHYDAVGELPAVCGVDGVGLLEDGRRVFCGGSRAPYGTMAERTVVSEAWCLPAPDGIDDIIAAALPNPALSSWLPLVWRAKLEPAETVLVLGATGVAGMLAVQIAKHLGAGRVVGAGRDVHALQVLRTRGADRTISLAQADAAIVADFAAEFAAHPVDVVLDYLWGHPTELLLAALTGHDLKADVRRTRLIEIGEAAGPTLALSAAALRSSGLEIYGSGGGSVPRRAIRDAFPKLWDLVRAGGLEIDVDPVPLAEVDRAWRQGDLHGRRIVIVP